MSIDYFLVNSGFIGYFWFKPEVDHPRAKKTTSGFNENDSSERKSDSIPRIRDRKSICLEIFKPLAQLKNKPYPAHTLTLFGYHV